MTLNHPTSADPSREARRRRSIAGTFRRSDRYEALLKLKPQAETGNVVAHQQLEALSPLDRTSFGSYQSARSAAVAEGLIDETTGEPR